MSVCVCRVVVSFVVLIFDMIFEICCSIAHKRCIVDGAFTFFRTECRVAQFLLTRARVATLQWIWMKVTAAGTNVNGRDDKARRQSHSDNRKACRIFHHQMPNNATFSNWMEWNDTIWYDMVCHAISIWYAARIYLLTPHWLLESNLSGSCWSFNRPNRIETGRAEPGEPAKS